MRLSGFEIIRNSGLRKVLDLEVGTYLTQIQIDEWSDAAQPIMRIRFKVGDVGWAQDGDTQFFLRGCDGNLVLDKKVVLYRENEIVTEGDSEFGFTYDSLTAKITTIPELNKYERMEAWVFRKAAFIVCGDQGDLFVINDNNDSLMINDLDKFVFVDSGPAITVVPDSFVINNINDILMVSELDKLDI